MARKHRDEVETTNSLNIPMYDFIDGKLVTVLPRCGNIIRVAARVITPRILDLLSEIRCNKIWNYKLQRYVLNTSDREIGIINSYLVRNIIDDTYNNVEPNPCIFTPALENEIQRLQLEKCRKL